MSKIEGFPEIEEPYYRVKDTVCYESRIIEEDLGLVYEEGEHDVVLKWGDYINCLEYHEKYVEIYEGAGIKITLIKIPKSFYYLLNWCIGVSASKWPTRVRKLLEQLNFE